MESRVIRSGIKNAGKKPIGKPGGRPFEKGDPRAGRPKGVPNKVTREIREAARQIMDKPEYREALEKRLLEGKCAPAVECMLWHYAYGAPPKEITISPAGEGGLGWLPGPLAIQVYEAFLATTPGGNGTH